ncbi:Ig-like domain-containing protein [Wenzhouxiangella marina]|uniref:Uncharacterized protein n=1 Tax=Wenzhouxiangella marina TaxID=1579979 RepID=A0A0K0XTL3_9GAMM|nr:Ig-like domain-containing protein [Wenzhouxiangella marina]AKS40962.1 hypothetical protein WM2015_580 [Wenzhouxiangella marina]MBB6087836.1 hypothetical protein [Wenzhouxiangella marina]
MRPIFLLLGWAMSLAAQAAVITVNSTGTLSSTGFADDGLCTLFEAVAAANDNAPSGSLPGECLAGESGLADRIEFDPSILPASIVIEAPLVFTEAVEIAGPHRDLLTLQGIGVSRVMELSNTTAAGNYLIRGLSIDGGYAGTQDTLQGIGGGVYARHSGIQLTIEGVRFSNNGAAYAGGALAIVYGLGGTTVIRDSSFESNTAQGISAINDGGGGAIWIGGFQTVVIERSAFIENESFGTVSGNPGSDAGGGAIWMLSSSATAVSTLDVYSSTFSGNRTTGVGGAIAIGGPNFPTDVSEVGIRHSTFTLNVADSDSDGDFLHGGAIYSSAQDEVVLFNSILARNVDQSSDPAPNLRGQYESLGHNFISNNVGVQSQFPFGIPNAQNDFASNPDLDPGLEPLADNGGPTLTHALAEGALPLDQGRCSSQVTDQRGSHDRIAMTRAVDQGDIGDLFDGCDIGAYERNATPAALPRTVEDIRAINEDRALIAWDVDGSGSTSFVYDDGVLANDSHDTGQPLVVVNAGSFEATSTDMSSGGTVELSSNGLFTYTPPADEFGTAEISYRVSDGIETVTGTVTITVWPVNDPPSFSPSTTSINATVSGVPVVVPAYATQIDPGAANESDQALSFEFTIVEGNPGLLASAPSIDPVSGDLSYEIASGASGYLLLDVVLVDDGGSFGESHDRSEPAPLTITASADAPSVTILSPADAAEFDAGQLVSFEGTASHPDDGDLSTQIEWRSDLDGVLGTGSSLPVSSLSVGQHRIGARVVAGNGVPGIAFIDLRIHPSMTEPVVIIDAPLDGQGFIVGAAIDFSGEAVDAEDGSLDAELRWSSNLQGMIGSGPSFQTSQLIVGTHVISARAIDSDQQVGLDQVTIFVEAPPSDRLFEDRFEFLGEN